jgi:hypothetical protein
VPEIPQFILERARANAGVFTADEVAEWPAGLLDQLVASGVLRADQPAKTVTCDSCGDDHVEVVQYVESPPGTGLRAYIPCPQLGRVLVPTARLRRWSVDMNVMAIEPATRASKPVDTSNQVPHALVVAHASLIGTLTQAEDLYGRTLGFPNPSPVLDAIERFVHELKLVPACFVELQQRSSLVERRCAADSGYDATRHQALQTHSAVPANLCSAKLALERLRNSSTQSPRFLQEVIDVRKSIESLLADQTAGLSANAVAAFGAWRDECRPVQLEAERLHVDGCWYLLHVYQSAGSTPSERAQAARAILQTNMGGAHLHDLLLAAESMMAWARENGLSTSGLHGESRAGQTPETPIVDEPLSERSQLVLVAMHLLEAFDSDRRKPTEEIAVKALGGGADPNALKGVMAELKTRELINSKTGRGGGCWLTESGRARAEKLRRI